MVRQDGRAARVQEMQPVPGGVVLQQGVPAAGVARAQAALPQEAGGVNCGGGIVIVFRLDVCRALPSLCAFPF